MVLVEELKVAVEFLLDLVQHMEVYKMVEMEAVEAEVVVEDIMEVVEVEDGVLVVRAVLLMLDD